uniref:NADH-ubiquinone oxidoreductase chain 2 n=1 Tax=Nosodendron sp. BMNH 840466 TaxID=904170 RepID=A0A343A466_9COLE|nr:NADH dehydrogenase subunit 2 [Nosodendron sp. BMNH 840466]
MMFLMMTFFSTIMSISSNSWMGVWVGMEINLLSIIPLMNNSKNLMESEASIKYFITQALASTIFLFSIIIMSMNFSFNFKMLAMMLILNSSLLTKMGAAPFHFWFPEIMEGLNWTNNMIMLTWQKITPMIILMYNKMFFFLSIIIIISMIISSLMSLNQTSLRKILTYSSINHIGWMMSSFFFLESIWNLYFIIYSIMTINMIIMFKYLNIFYFKQLFYSMNNNFYLKMIFIINFLSLSGLPPFLGFLPKWITIQSMISNKILFLPMIMIMLTLMMMFIYLRITFSTLMIMSNEMNSFLFKKSNKYLWMTTNLTILMSFIFYTFMLNWL